MLKSLSNDETWAALAQSDRVAIAAIRNAVLEMEARLKKLDAEAMRDPILWCDQD